MIYTCANFVVAIDRIKQCWYYGKVGSVDMKEIIKEQKRMKKITVQYIPEDQFSGDES